MRLYGLLGGQVRIHLQSVLQTRGIWGHAPPGNFGFRPDTICGIWNCFHKHSLHLSGVNDDFGPGILSWFFFVALLCH